MLATATFAQTTPTKKEAEKGLKKDVKKLEEQRDERDKKIVRGQFKKAHKKQSSVKATRKRVHANKKVLKSKGVKHPVEKAKDEVKM